MKAMNGRGSLALRGLLILLSAVVFGVAPALAQAPVPKQTAAVKPVRTTAKTQPIAQPSGGTREGIKVHGHWVIEVRNPDGTLATRREFENSLSVGGQSLLARLLTRRSSLGRWIVVLNADSGATQPCASEGQGNQPCGLYEGVPEFMLSDVATASTALAVTPLPNEVIPTRIELKGTITATANSTITRLSTTMQLCPATIAPATTCVGSPTSAQVLTQAFSTRGDFAPAPVVAGQFVQVTVTISFS